MLGCTVADIHRALDRAAQASMTPQARVRDIWVQAERMERAQQIFLPLMEGADDKAAMIVIKAQERRATLLGSNARLRVDPIALAAEAGPQLSSTENLRRIFDQWRARALGSGGPRDDADREEMAQGAERERDEVGADRPGVVPGE